MCIYFHTEDSKQPTDLSHLLVILSSRLYWSDWNRDGPKLEMANMDGTDRSVLVSEDLGLPNGLTFDPQTRQLCWADAGKDLLLTPSLFGLGNLII